MNDLTIMTANKHVSTKFSFKNAELNKLSTELAEQVNKAVDLYADIETRASAIAQAQSRILGKVLAGQLYKDDGFSSVEEYAANAFPDIGGEKAKKLAQAGVRFYNNESETAQAVVSMFGGTPLTMNELKTVPDETLKAAIEDGRLKKGMKQKDLRAFVTAVKEADGKPKTVNKYNIQLVLMTATETGLVTTQEVHNGVVGIGNAQAVAGWLGDDWNAYKTDIKYENGDLVYMAINKKGDKWARVQVYKVSETKSRGGKTKTINVLECTLDEYIAYMGGDVHDDDDREFYGKKLIKIRLQCKPAE